MREREQSVRETNRLIYLHYLTLVKIYNSDDKLIVTAVIF
jgi:hypothetical protein